MDVLSQAVVGAAAAMLAVRDKAHFGKAALVGALSGMAADLDVLIKSESDPLLVIEMHRHFTHALAFIPFGALLVAAALWLLPHLRRAFGFKGIYLYAFLGYATHGLLDTCTSYGTRLLWPFSDARLTWDLIAIIDPLFTLPLMALAIIAVWKQSARVAWGGAAYMAFYFLLCFIQHERAESAVRELAEARGHTIERIAVRPTMANIVLWRGMYISGGRIYVDAVRVGLAAMRYEGGSVELVDARAVFPGLGQESVARRDLLRYAHFADYWLGRKADAPQVLGDLRYGRLPNGVDARWGVEVDVAAPDAHLSRTRRMETPGVEPLFWHMLLGKSPAAVRACQELITKPEHEVATCLAHSARGSG